MDRKMIAKNGYTIFEILLVVILISILMAIGIIPLKNAKERFDIEQDMRNIYGILQKGRMYAFTNKQNVYLDLTTWCLKRSDNGVISCIEIKKTLYNNCSDNKVNINERGVFNDPCSVYYNTDLNPTYSCVSISITKVKMGAWINGKCIEK